jgi:hypothetical protein
MTRKKLQLFLSLCLVTVDILQHMNKYCYQRWALSAMRLLTSTILLFLTQTLFAQLGEDLKNKLALKDFQSFKKYADSLSNGNSHIKIYWEVDREIAAGFQERILTVTKSVPEEKNPNYSTVYTFKINMLSADTTIFFYDLMECKSKKEHNEWVEYYPTIDIYENDTLFLKLETTFFQSFGGQLKRKGLFIDSIEYGARCGYAGIAPLEKMHLDHLVKRKDKTSLVKWLQSTNVETQIYAVEGFYKLKKAGYRIKENELQFIRNILKKKGTIRTCAGCRYGRNDIQAIVKNFEF